MAFEETVFKPDAAWKRALEKYGAATHLTVALYGRGHVRLIAVTGYGQPEDQRRTEEAGFDAHLTEPVSCEQIAEVLEGG